MSKEAKDSVPQVGQPKRDLFGQFIDEEFRFWSKFGGFEGWASQMVGLRKVIHDPAFTSGQLMQIYPGLTYRQINNWESEGLIEPGRATEGTGWRKFSLYDIAVLGIVSEMRSLGTSVEIIKDKVRFLKYPHLRPGLLAQLAGEPPRTDETFPDDQLTKLEAFIVLSLWNRIGVVTSMQSGLIIGPADILQIYMASLLGGTTAFVYVPFSEHIRRAFKLRGKELPEPEEGYVKLLGDTYRQIFWLIQSEDTESITIKKQKGGKLNVRRLRRKQGVFNPMDVVNEIESNEHARAEIVKKDGRVITIMIEDRMQVEE